MKTIKTILMFMSIILAGCGRQTEDQGTLNSREADNTLKVMFQVIMERGGSISLYYTSDGSINFNSKQVITKAVDAKTELQEVLFELPKDITDTQLRVDFTSHRNNKNIVFKRFKVFYGDKLIDAYETEVFRFFMPDITKCKVNRETGLITPVVEDGQVQTPSFYPYKELFANRLHAITHD
jgi:hypothetical protein